MELSDHKATERVHATFRLWGETLDPEIVTTRFGLAPSERFKSGDKRGTSSLWRHGYWALYSEAQVQSPDLEHHIEWLLGNIEPVKIQLQALVDEGNYADVFCFWESSAGHAGVSFHPRLLGRLAALGLRLEVDIYFAS